MRPYRVMPVETILIELTICSLDINHILGKAAKLNQVMRENQLGYAQAQAWLKKETHIWFLLGREKIQDRSLSKDAFLDIASHLSRLSDQDTVELLNRHMAAIPKKMLEASSNGATLR